MNLRREGLERTRDRLVRAHLAQGLHEEQHHETNRRVREERAAWAAFATVAPEARNRPVPIAPPMAIICMWRDARPRFSCVSERCCTSLAMSSGVGVSINGFLVCRS